MLLAVFDALSHANVSECQVCAFGQFVYVNMIFVCIGMSQVPLPSFALLRSVPVSSAAQVHILIIQKRQGPHGVLTSCLLPAVCC